MSKLTVNVLVEKEVRFLHVTANVRYWEDATVNGVKDIDGSLIPCRDGSCWCPIIDLTDGKITNWANGVTAEIHYKVCDEGIYALVSSNGEIVKSVDNGYVPKILCPKENGYGDYIIMDISDEGFIKGFKPSLDYFESEEY